jgi:hypothetical protein
VPPDLLDGVDEWLVTVGSQSVANVPNLLDIGESLVWDDLPEVRDERARLNLEFDEDAQILSRLSNTPLSDRQVNDRFLSLETTVLTSYGFSFDIAGKIARSLLSFRQFRRGRGVVVTGELGNGVSALAESARQRLSAGVVSIAALKSVLRRGNLAVLLSAAIEADGMMVDGLDVVMPSTAASSVCRLSQLLAEAKGYYEASKAW